MKDAISAEVSTVCSKVLVVKKALPAEFGKIAVDAAKAAKSFRNRVDTVEEALAKQAKIEAVMRSVEAQKM